MANGKEIKSFTSLSINQVLNDHHTFELVFNHDVIENSDTLNITKSKDYLGKTITFTLNALEPSEPDHVFKGLITNVSFANSLNTNGDIIFKGFSTTILLETQEGNASFEDDTLSTIIKTTTKDASANILSMNINPSKKTPIPYVVKYRESNFGFIRRMAAENGEWCYYDGTNFNFGTSSSDFTIELMYPNDVSEYDLQMNMKHVNIEEHSYLPATAQKITADSSSVNVDGLDSLGKHALKTSEEIFNSISTTLSTGKFKEQNEIAEELKITYKGFASDLVMLRASSDCPQIKIGTTVNFSCLADGDTINYGKYIVISANHEMDGLGNYKNTFEAIPASTIVPPNPFGKKPIAESQIATVKDNKDPDGMGRVKVQMMWQVDDEKTPWVLVMSPNAGKQNDSKKNRGFMFTPEIEDYVVVGFEQNDPDKPFVLGSVFNGKSIDTSLNKDTNQSKGIRTRMGNSIIMNDWEDDQKQSIMIRTDKENYIQIDLEKNKGTISIFANKVIELNSKEVINIKSAKKINVNSGETINIKSGTISVEASDKISLHATKEIELKAANIKIEANDSIEAKAMNDLKLEGLKAEIKGSVSTKVSGGVSIDLEGGAMANIKGALVKIN